MIHSQRDSFSYLKLDDDVMKSVGMGRVFKDSTQRINSLDFFESDDLLVTASDDDAIRLYNVSTGVLLDTFYSRKYGVQNITFTHSPDCVIMSSKEAKSVPSAQAQDVHVIRYMSLHTNTFKRYFKGHVGPVSNLSLSSRDDTFLSASLDKTVRLWDLRTDTCQGVLRLPAAAEAAPIACMDNQGLVFAVASEGGRIFLFDTRSSEKGAFASFQIPDESQSPLGFSDLKFSHDGTLISAVSQYGRGSVYILGAFDGELKCQFTNGIHRGYRNCGAGGGGGAGWGGISNSNLGINNSAGVGGGPGGGGGSNGPTPTYATLSSIGVGVAGGFNAGGTGISNSFSNSTNPQPFSYSSTAFLNPRPEACITADNKYVLAGCDDRHIRVWNLDTGSEVATWQGHAGVPFCLRASPRRLVFASACSALALWIPNPTLLSQQKALLSERDGVGGIAGVAGVAGTRVPMAAPVGERGI